MEKTLFGSRFKTPSVYFSGKQTVHNDKIKTSKGPIPVALKQMCSELFLPDEEQVEVANDSLDNDIFCTSMDDASPTSDPCRTGDSLDNNVAGVYQTRGGRNVRFPG